MAGESLRFMALDWLYGQQRKAKIDLGRAESKPGHTAEEIEGLNKKLVVLDWLIGVAMKEG